MAILNKGHYEAQKKNFKIIDELSRIEFCIETIYAITYPPLLYR